MDLNCAAADLGNELSFSGHPVTNLKLATDGSAYLLPGEDTGDPCRCFYSTLPADVNDSETRNVLLTEQPGINYVSIFGKNNHMTTCIWSYEVDPTNNFRSKCHLHLLQHKLKLCLYLTLVGIIFLLSGLVWFRNRIKTKLS